MNLPTFFCVGAQKSGTTTLHDILKQHSDICLPLTKETKFFFNGEDFSKGLGYYSKKFFGNCTEGQILGEIDPEYMLGEEVPERIFSTLGPNIKLIFMLRNPVDRAYSQYWMSVRRGFEDLPFMEALRIERNRIQRDDFSFNHFSYIERGRYATLVKQFLKYFQVENMRFIIFETDFLKDREATVQSLLQWIGVSIVPLRLGIQSNSATMFHSHFVTKFVHQTNAVRKIGKVLIPFQSVRRKIMLAMDRWNQVPLLKPELTKKERAHVYNDFFKSEVSELEAVIGRSLDHWREIE